MVAAYAEYAKAVRKDSAVVLSDLVKAFEHIKHSLLLAQAIAFGFNLVVLRFLLRIYAMPRLVSIGRVVAGKVAVNRTVVLGDPLQI